jgi:hypothetical protein
MQQFEGCIKGDQEKEILQMPLTLDIGYAQSPFGKQNPLPRFAFQLLNGVGDFLDLLPALHPESDEFARLRVKAGSMCSALIKVIFVLGVSVQFFCSSGFS